MYTYIYYMIYRHVFTYFRHNRHIWKVVRPFKRKQVSHCMREYGENHRFSEIKLELNNKIKLNDCN